MNDTYYTTEEWEAAKPTHIEFTEFGYHATGLVSQVLGTVNILTLQRKAGKQYKMVAHKASWDNMGRCSLKHKGRKRDYDIHLINMV